jgi:hypothetical protein
MPVTLILRAITSEFILRFTYMAYEPSLDPEDCPMTAEWHEERDIRLQRYIEWVQSLDETDDLDKAIRFCRRASH